MLGSGSVPVCAPSQSTLNWELSDSARTAEVVSGCSQALRAQSDAENTSKPNIVLEIVSALSKLSCHRTDEEYKYFLYFLRLFSRKLLKIL